MKITKEDDTRWMTALLDATTHDRRDGLERLLAERAPAPELRAHLALRASSDATRRWLLDGCVESATFHRGAVAIARDDADAVREAHAAGVDWAAALGAPVGWSAVHLAAALGQAASLRALAALGVDVDRAEPTSAYRWTPLVLAMQRGRWDAARALLEAPIDPNRVDVMDSLPGAPRDVLDALVAHGLRMDFVAANAALMAASLTPESLRALVEVGMRVDDRVLADVLICVGHARRPDEAYVALARELLRIHPPPASGVVDDPGGGRTDFFERVLRLLPLQVAEDLVAAGVTKRKVRVGSHARDAAEKKAWLGLPTPPRAGDPALPFGEFVGLADDDLTEAAIAAQLAPCEGGVAFGPVRLGMRAEDLGPIAPSAWERDGDGRWFAQSFSDGNHREHRVMLEVLEDGGVFHVQYRVMFNRRSETGPSGLDARLTELLGKPTRKVKQAMTWLRGDVRASVVSGSGDGARFGEEVAFELVDERYKERALRHHRLAKF